MEAHLGEHVDQLLTVGLDAVEPRMMVEVTERRPLEHARRARRLQQQADRNRRLVPLALLTAALLGERSIRRTFQLTDRHERLRLAKGRIWGSRSAGFGGIHSQAPNGSLRHGAEGSRLKRKSRLTVSVPTQRTTTNVADANGAGRRSSPVIAASPADIK